MVDLLVRIQVSIIACRLTLGRSYDWGEVWKKVFISLVSWGGALVLLLLWVAYIIALTYRKVFTKKVREKISKYLETPPRWL